MMAMTCSPDPFCTHKILEASHTCDIASNKLSMCMFRSGELKKVCELKQNYNIWLKQKLIKVKIINKQEHNEITETDKSMTEHLSNRVFFFFFLENRHYQTGFLSKTVIIKHVFF